MTRKKAANKKKATESHLKNTSAKYWIERLRLERHPEGGYFRQTYKSGSIVEPQVSENSRPTKSTLVAKSAIRVGQPGPGGARAASTAIYFLLEGKSFSAFHRLRWDEMWHFYGGSPLVVHVINAAGEYSSIFLGDDPGADQVFQAVVKAGCWFASEIVRNPHPSTGSGQAFTQNRGEAGHPPWALVGCTVAPGFEFEDFELAKREELMRRFPQHRELIERLTRQ
jgi:uncharacterized protein